MKEVVIDFKRSFFQASIAWRIGLGFHIDYQGIQILILCFYIGYHKKYDTWKIH